MNFPLDAMWTAAAMNMALCVFNFRNLVRGIKANRYKIRMVVLATAYEKELEAKGVSLEPRCIECSQTLPKHVEGCQFADFYLQRGLLLDILTRPPTKYYGGKKGSAG